MNRLLYPLVFVAGAGTMATEMCASRLLAPFFGASILIWANIIGLILIYLSVGYFWGGRLADRHPSLPYMCRLIVCAAMAIAVIPFVSEPLLSAAVGAFAQASVGAFLGSFFASMALFSVPITLLGMVSPFAVRLAVDSVERAGEIAGRLYALSTAGSILGTFLPVVLLIPLIGTRRTMLATAAVLALAATPALGWRYVLAPAAVVALALVPPGLVKPGSGVIWEGESAYQFIQVQATADGGRVLHLNEGWAKHSVWHRDRVLTGGYWDQFLLAPDMHGPGFGSLAMIGYAGGTVGRAYGTFLARRQRARYRARPQGHRHRAPLLRAGIEPAGERGHGRRPPLPGHPHDPIRRDLPGCVPPALHPVLPDHAGVLAVGGRAAAAGRDGDGRRRHDPRRRAPAQRDPGTMVTVFPRVYRWRVGGFNESWPGSRGGLAAQLRARLAAAAPALDPAADLAEGLQPQTPSSDPLTDDRAPVEWLTDQLIVRYADGG